MKCKAANLFLVVAVFFCGSSRAITMREFFKEPNASCDVVSKVTFISAEIPHTLQQLNCKSSQRELHKALLCSPDKSDDVLSCAEDDSVPQFFKSTFVDRDSKSASCRYSENWIRGIAIPVDSADEDAFCTGSLNCAGAKPQQVVGCKARDVVRDSSGKVLKISCGNADFCAKNPLPKVDAREANTYVVSKDRPMLTNPRTEKHKRGPNSL